MTVEGRCVRQGPVGVLVPASSANVGPGFDCIGLALGLYDRCEVVALPDPRELDIRVSGQGEGTVPSDESHLVVRALRAGLDLAGVQQPGLRLNCTNAIPHGRGLGSSATAIIAGLMLARALVHDPAEADRSQADRAAVGDVSTSGPLDDAALLDLATQFEGHPDNVSASLLGGMTVSWCEPETEKDQARARAVALPVHPDIHPVVCVPGRELATTKARAMLPQDVPHADAAFTAGRAALLVHAMSERPELLLPATQERLHQDYRASAMPESLELVRQLRSEGLAAVVSGAGPTVLVLTVGGSGLERVTRCTGDDWDVTHLSVDTQGAQLVAVSN